MNPARFRWGVLFILAGVLLLLNNVDRLDWWVWADIASLWPILLIAIGVEKIFAHTRAQAVSYLSTVAMAAVVLYVAWGGMGDYRTDRSTDWSYSADGKTISRLVGQIDMHKNDLTLRGNGTSIVRARYDGSFRQPRIAHDIKGAEGHFTVDDRSPWRWTRRISRYYDDITVFVSDSFPLTLTCNGDQGNMRLDCRDLKLDDLTVSADDGSMRIMLGRNSNKVRVTLKGKDPEFRLEVPGSCALTVQGGGTEAGAMLRRLGLTQSGSSYVTMGADTLSPKIELNLSPEVSDLAIEYY